MAGQGHFLTRLIALLSALDDDAYTAVSSRGLLRRARKELERGVDVSLNHESEEGVEVAVGHERVSLDDKGPSGAKCTCPATGTCQHVIIACLALPGLAPGVEGGHDESPKQVVAEEDGSDEWIDLHLGNLKKWAGGQDYRKACALVHDQLDSVAGFKIKFKTGVDCHLVTTAGLDGVITSAAPRMHKAYVAAAVLAYRQSKGEAVPELKSESAPMESHTETLGQIQNLLEECVELGLDHLASTTLSRLRTLAVQARAARLYRPAKELENCITDIEWLLQRHASADSTRLFDRMARLYALMEALRNHGDERPIGLTGTARSHYSATADLKLIGVGAYPWRTDSGYSGLTVLFWAPEEGAFYSWSDVRPEGSADDFTPRKRFGGESPWPGGGPLSKLCFCSFTLVNAHANDERRLSARDDSRVEDLRQEVMPDAYPQTFTDWGQMRQFIADSKTVGLQQKIALDDLVVIQPSKWGKPEFDEIDQQLIVEMQDCNGEALPLLLPFSADTESAIRHLEKAKFQNKRTRLLAYHRSHPHPHVFPVALIEEEKEKWNFVNLLLVESTRQVRGFVKKLLRDRLPASFLPLQRELQSGSAPELTPLGQFLSPLDELLTQLAGSGVHRYMEQSGWEAIIRQLESSGMIQLARSARRLARSDSPHPRDLLVSRYLQLLHLESA